jgi:hypothetical protein
MWFVGADGARKKIDGPEKRDGHNLSRYWPTIVERRVRTTEIYKSATTTRRKAATSSVVIALLERVNSS